MSFRSNDHATHKQLAQFLQDAAFNPNIMTLPMNSNLWFRLGKNSVVSYILGLVVGVLTLIGQKYLPMNLNFLANSGAVWLIPAFLLSYHHFTTF